jgi:hypothetical protein
LLSSGVVMIRLPRWFIVIIASLFVLSPAATGAIGLLRTEIQFTNLLALGLYIVIGLIFVLYYRELRMPLPLALIGLAMAVIVPQLVNLPLDESSFGTPATWYVSAVSTLMAISAIRQHKVIAWLGTGILTVEVLIWGGVDALFNSGLGGAIALVAAAHAISVGLQIAAQQTAAYLETAKATEAASAAETAVRAERSDRITKTLQGALPMLEKISATGLSQQDRQEAVMLEAQLRDEIRGRELINPKLKASVRAARSRGVEVVLLDEGGLEQLSESERDALRNRLADELDVIESGRVTIRSPKQEKIKVTFVASRKGTAKPDVFLRL